MALTSTEITRMIQPMKDFAPAILRCAEIVAAAEEAERVIREQASTVKAAQAELASLAKLKQEADAELVALRGSVETTKEETAAEKKTLADSLKITKAALKLAQDTLESTQKDHANTLAAHKQELDGLEIVIETKRKELADFRRAIPKTY